MPIQTLPRKVLLFIAIACTAAAVLSPGEAGAQCAVRDALHRQGVRPLLPAAVESGARANKIALPVWKTIALGTFANSLTLRNALDSAGCGIGDLAEEALARREFAVQPARTDADLVVVSPAELGLAGDLVSLADTYARAEARGLRTVPAEVGPQLRLQYLDQPAGEFLHLAMRPIRTWDGIPVILVVANGGAGLILVGEFATTEKKIPASSRFVFLRPRDTGEQW